MPTPFSLGASFSARPSRRVLISLCFLCILFAGRTPAHAQSAPQAVAVAVGGDNLTRLLWNNPGAGASLWSLNADGSVAAQTPYGPFTGWTANALALGANNAPRLLWNNTDGRCSLWNASDANPSATCHIYGPYGGWTAASLAVGGSNAARLLWTNTSGQVTLWNTTDANPSATCLTYGPYSGWTAKAIAAGADSKVRVLWNNADGHVSVWNQSDANPGATCLIYGPYAGWSGKALAVGFNNAARLLWVNTSGQVSVWNLTDANPSATCFVFPPPAGYAAVGLAVGGDNLVRLLWSDGQGNAQVWTVAADGTYTAKIYPSLSSLSVSPASVSGAGSATGTVTLTNPAPVGGVTVTLSSSSGSASVPASVVVAAGQSTGTFPVTTSAVSAATMATLTATFSGITKTAALTVNPAAPASSAPSLTAAATGANKVTLYWNGSAGASGYNVYRSTVSGGPYTQIASSITTADTGPGMVGAFMYSDTAGLATGTEYFYVVTAVQSGTEGVQSNENSAIPDPSAIAWDSGNATQIVSQVGTMVANNLASDEPAVGELTIGGPDGVIYQSFQDGSPAQAYAAPGHYSVSNRTLVYADGNEVPAPIDTTDSDPGIPTAASSSTGQSVTAASATVSLKFKQSLGHAYNPTKIPSGIFREVQTQPGYSSLLTYVGLPDVMDTSLSYIDGRKYQPGQPNSSIFPGGDTGYIYSGGTAFTTVAGKDGTTKTYMSELDAGLMLFRTNDPAHPGWVPVINPPTGLKVFDGGFVGYPLEDDTAAVGAGCNIAPKVFVSGEPLMSFKAAGYGTIPDGVVVMSIHAETDGNVFKLINGVRTQVGDITFVRGGITGWTRKARIVIKRMNSIAQNIKPVPGSKPITYTPVPNGPGGGFNLAGSFVYGASWGDINADDEAIDGVNVFPYGQWDVGLTWQEGSYPVGNPYMGYLVQNQFFWEQYINLHT